MAYRQVFIVGTGRCGTGILKKTLGTHSKIYTYPWELRFISDRYGLVDLFHRLTRDWNPFNASEAIVSFYRLMTEGLWDYPLHEKILYTGMRALYKTFGIGYGRRYRKPNFSEIFPYQDYRKVLEKFIDDITFGTSSGHWAGANSYQMAPQLFTTRQINPDELYSRMGGFVDSLLSIPLENSESHCWCDDTPINITNAHHIVRMLEGARIIHIYRDPRDVVSSYAEREQHWSPNSVYQCTKWVKQIYLKWKKIKKKLSTKSFLEVRYEEVVSSQEKVMKKIAKFVGIKYLEEMMSVKFDDRSVGRYKNDLSGQQIENVEAELHEVLSEYSYQ
jgi:hypothetical protein